MEWIEEYIYTVYPIEIKKEDVESIFMKIEEEVNKKFKEAGKYGDAKYEKANKSLELPYKTEHYITFKFRIQGKHKLIVEIPLKNANVIIEVNCNTYDINDELNLVKESNYPTLDEAINSIISAYVLN